MLGRKPVRLAIIAAAVLSLGAAGGPSEADQVARVLSALAIILVVAKVAGALFETLRLPAVLGELLAGVALGNLQHVGVGGLEFITHEPTIKVLAEIGVVLLLFEVGLESDVTQMIRVGASSFMVAAVGVVTPMALGYGVAHFMLPQLTWHTHLFIGAILCATSVGITARVLKDIGKIQTKEGRIILGAAVIDDVMGLVVLAVVQGIIAGAVAGKGLDAWEIAKIVLKAIGFLGGAIVIGGRLSKIVFKTAGTYLRISGLLLALSLAVCFGLAYAAHAVGLAPIVGAFAAGLILDEVTWRPLAAREHHGLEELVHPIAAFLVPVFFVVTGAHVDVRVLGDTSILVFAAQLTGCAIIGKQACSFAVLERGLNRLAVGLGMIPRGEVGLIFASVGSATLLPSGQAVVDPRTYAAVIIMVMVTTLVTPPVLSWSLRRGGSS